VSAPAAISVEGLGKRYEIYAKPRDRLLQSVWGGRRQFFREFWALRDVALDVPKGDALGIIGRNGSGKSTLLQIICGTVTPTTGTVRTSGRVAALLELGSGFNPEMTGRENVVLNATILGLTPAEIDERFDSIVAFSEIADFLDQPIKTYSSGMSLRLAFAVAINVDADILVVDEALAVGDARFQLKCARAMDRLRDEGKTLLFVSHDGGAIKRLCSEAILLDHGRMLLRARPNDALNIYSKLLADDRGAAAVADDIAALAQRQAHPTKADPASPVSVGTSQGGHDPRVALLMGERQDGALTGNEFSYGGELGRIESIVLTDADAKPRSTFTTGDRLHLDALLAVGGDDLVDTIYAVMIKDTRGVDVYGTNTFFQNQSTPRMAAGGRYRVSFDLSLNLMPGTYFVSVGWTYFHGAELRVVHRRYDTVTFEVLPQDRSIGIANCFGRIGVEAVS
jgi:lipopolysaccharide transport system ATP-binding protein